MNRIKEPAGATLPVESECNIASWNEAVLEFAKIGIYGIPQLYYIEDIADEQINSVVWAVIQNDVFEYIPAFNFGYARYNYQDFFHQIVDVNEVFQINGHFYIVTLDDDNRMLIKELRIAYTQEIALACAACFGHSSLDEIYLGRLFSISENQRYLTTAWLGFSEKENMRIYISLFMDDCTIFNNYKLSDINCEFLNLGDSFEHEGVLYRTGKMICSSQNKKPHREWFIEDVDMTEKLQPQNKRPRPKVSMQITVNNIATVKTEKLCRPSRTTQPQKEP